MHSSSRGQRAAQPPSIAFTVRVVMLLLPVLCLLAPAEARAYPWLIKHSYGTSCGECHADPSGGELLTGYGRGISMMTLSTVWGGSEGSAKNQRGLERKLALRAPETFAAGAKWATPEMEEGDAADDSAAPAAGDDATASEDAEAAPAETPAVAQGSAQEAQSEPTYYNAFFDVLPLPDWLLLGASYRHLNILPIGGRDFSTFPMMMDLQGQATFGDFRVGGSVGVARVAAGSPFARRAQITANQGKDWNVISRTHYLGYEIVPQLVVRAGRLNLPFGVRIPEHTMWVRQATYTDRESSQQHGVAIAYNAGSLRTEVMGIAGNYQVNPDKFRERGYAGYVEYAASPTAVYGLSSMVTVSQTDRTTLTDGKTTRQVHGLMSRVGFAETFALLTEIDGIFTSSRDPGYVGFAQFDMEPLQGVHFMVTGEMLDEGHPTTPTPSPRAPGAGKPRVGGWLSANWFFISHFDVRFDVIKRTQEDLWVLAQLHAYL